MTRDEFGRYYVRALDVAAVAAEKKLGHPIPRVFRVELHAPGFLGQVVAAEAALDAIFLGVDRFYKIIDVAVKEFSSIDALVFVRVSGHEPVEWAKTWNPDDLGPFKQILANDIRRK